MDKCSTDAEFDSYWDYEAKNKERNRIRVGRQYQATIPPRLRPGEKDGRKCEDLETLKWRPGLISDQDVEQYLSMAKGISLFARAVDPSKTSAEKSDNSLQSAIKGLSEFVASHHPHHHDDGCTFPSSSGESSSKVNATSDWSPSEAQLFAQALEACGKNFCAIKKEFLPWKPVRSIIEYYYQGKGDKGPSQNLDEIKKEEPDEKKIDDLSQIKTDDEPVPGCSYEEKPPPAKQEIPSENLSPQNLDSNSKADTVNFLEISRATDACPDGADVKPTSAQNEDTKCASSTVGSLKFFLGGRLVLKLNARQDSGSGTAKCQWVQSNDVPKHSNPSKRVKHKKKSIQDFISSPETPQKKKKTAEAVVTPKLPEHSLSASKKPRIKSEYEFSESDKQGMLLCSSYWTPPIADGQEAVDADDASSKTSEGYVSPILSNSRPPKAEARSEISGNVNSLHDSSEKGELDQCSNRYNSAQSELNSDDSASKNISFVGGKNSPCQFAEDAFSKQELLNHKSALSHSKLQGKSPSFPQRTSHSNSSQLIKQWSKLSSVSYPMRTCSVSPISVLDCKSPIKADKPMDLSSKPESETAFCPLEKNGTNADCLEKVYPPEAESRPASNEFSSPSSSFGTHQLIAESPKAEMKRVSGKDSSCCSAKVSGETSQISYTCCNLPNCASPKCTKDDCSDDHLCNKGNPDNSQESCSGYSIQEMDESMCKKNLGWCKGSYVQFYPQCYPYYLTYSVSPSPGSDSSGTEAPLDLSAAKVSLNENADILTDEVNDLSHSNSAEAVERGMLYQLLKNKSSK